MPPLGGQYDCKGCTFSQMARSYNDTAMVLNNFFANGESDTRAFICVFLMEALKDGKYFFNIDIIEPYTIITENELEVAFGTSYLVTVSFSHGQHFVRERYLRYNTRFDEFE